MTIPACCKGEYSWGVGSGDQGKPSGRGVRGLTGDSALRAGMGGTPTVSLGSHSPLPRTTDVPWIPRPTPLAFAARAFRRRLAQPPTSSSRLSAGQSQQMFSEHLCPPCQCPCISLCASAAPWTS